MEKYEKSKIIDWFAEFVEVIEKDLSEIKLNIIGLMVLPPNDDNTEKYFSNVSQLNYELGLTDLSMGMSEDYLKAIEYYSTYLRVGSKIFGPRG